MEEIFKILGNRLASFFTRSVAPSSFFFVLLFFNDVYFNNYEIFKYLKKISDVIKNTDLNLLYLSIIILFLSYGYLNQLLSQLQDDFIKGNYSENTEYVLLRDKAFKSLDEKIQTLVNDIDYNDYNLYQILGKDIDVGSSYVDYVKSIHTLATSLSLNIIIFSVISGMYINLLFILLILPTSYFISKRRYKARNKRLYINYLLKKEEKSKDKKELKLKIKTIKVEIDE